MNLNGNQSNRKLLCDIASKAFEVVSTLLSRDQQFSRELRSEKTGSRQIYREESITTEMATSLLTDYQDNIEMTLFSSVEEAQTGADWYWRIEVGDRAMHAYVQAKRVQRTEFAQNDDQGRININIPQLKKLVNATAEEAKNIIGLKACLATFARFTATPPCGKSNLNLCRQHRHCEPCVSNQPCLWIADAQEIVNTNWSTASVRQVVEKSIRLDCLLPCMDETPETGPATKGFMLQSGVPTYSQAIAAIQSSPLLSKEVHGALRIYV